MTHPLFAPIEPYPGDPILTLNEDFQKDPRPHKVNLAIGIYVGEDGKLPVLESVRRARAGLGLENVPCPYLPMEGLPPLLAATQSLVFGAGHAAVAVGRVATIQAVGGSGALRLAAEFLRGIVAEPVVWVSTPTWDNHRAEFEAAGFRVEAYPYYDAATGGVDFPAMKAALAALPAGALVLLHACCHNPTGADLAPEQWRELLEVVRERSLLPFFDMAYQGFGEGIDADAYAPRLFAEALPAVLVATSYAKTFSLYGERCGTLSVVAPGAAEAALSLGQLKRLIRRNYSSPPASGARVVAAVLGDATLRAQWQAELDAMRARMLGLRSRFAAALAEARTPVDAARVARQRGMFSYTGLGAEQVEWLKRERAIYLLRSGRLCVAGLSERTLAPVVEAMAALPR